MSEDEVTTSDIYVQKSVVFEKAKQYLISANSGNGKTSILNFLYGVNFDFTGRILYNGLTVDDVFSLRKTKISYVFQDLKLFQELTVLENIRIKNDLTNQKSIDEICFWLEQVSLGHKINSLVKHLSLGQKQRVAILRALCQPFEVLLLDEPFSHLDSDNIKIVSNIVKQEVEANKATLIMTSLEESEVFTFDKTLNL